MDSQLVAILESLTVNSEAFFFLSFIFLLFAGEPIVLGFTFITTTLGMISVWQIFIFAFVAAILAELFWFLLARTKLFKKYKLSSLFPTLAKDMNYLSHKSGLSSPLKLLFFSRFISGAAILVIIVLSQKDLPLRKFLFYSLLVNLFWSALIVTLGYYAALGYNEILKTFAGIANVIEISLAVLLTTYLIYRLASRALGTRALK
jgi:membrane protein DedA with SNARE-associated domain